jgi:TetR/AcrR family transcriptional repressor of nem operon
MARAREFDVDEALDRAMDLFWRRGYAATSLQDLLTELGIGSGSLYAAFGSKDKLYQLALERYSRRHAAETAARLESGSDVRSALRAVLTEIVEADLADPGRGCMVVNAVTERASEPVSTETALAAIRGVETAIAGALERARARGEISPEKDPAQLARLLTTLVQGLRVVGQARTGREFVEDVVSAALGLLD